MLRVPRPAGITAAALALGPLAAAPASGVEPTVSDPRVVAHFDLARGDSPENIALEPEGSADLTLSSARQVVNVTRQGHKRLLATLPEVANPHAPVVGAAVALGIARAQNGTLFVNYATGTGATGIWRIPVGGGRPRQIAQLPPNGFPDGLALDERRGVLYAADSDSTVVGAMDSRAAISALDQPAATATRTSRSRPVRVASPPGAGCPPPRPRLR